MEGPHHLCTNHVTTAPKGPTGERARTLASLTPNAEKVPAQYGKRSRRRPTDANSLLREIKAGFRTAADQPESASLITNHPQPDVATEILIPEAPH